MSYKITFTRHSKRHNNLLDNLALKMRYFETYDIRDFESFQVIYLRLRKITYELSKDFPRCHYPVIHTTCCVRGKISAREPSSFENPTGHVTSASIMIADAVSDTQLMALYLKEERS